MPAAAATGPVHFPLPTQDADRLKAVVDSLGVVPEMSEAVSAAYSSGSSQAAAADNAELRESLHEAAGAIEAARLQAKLSAGYLQRHILPPARRLAKAALGARCQAEAQMPTALEAARAAAARSCAYLRCANLGGGGGPAAGQGEGRLRCR